MEENIIQLSDDTLPSFNYLSNLSKTKEQDLEGVIKDWKRKHKGEDLENILEAEINNE